MKICPLLRVGGWWSAALLCGAARAWACIPTRRDAKGLVRVHDAGVDFEGVRRE